MKKNKKGIYIFIIVLLFICIIACSFFVSYFYYFRNDIINIKNITATRKIDVSKKVKFVNNNYFDFNEVSDEYITNLLDKVEFNFWYNYSFNKIVEGNYKYYIEGVVRNKDNSLNSTIYKSDVKYNDVNGNVINLNDNFTVDIIDCLRRYEELKNNYNLNLSTYVEYKVYIDFNVYNKYIDEKYKNQDVITVKIPISEQKTKINIVGKIDDSYKIYSKMNKKDKKLAYIICLEFLCAIILFALIILLIFKKLINLVGIYDNRLNYLLNTYSDLIIHLSGIPDLTNYDILFVKDFDDLVDAAMNIKVPINYVNIINHRECIFIVFSNNNAYVYKLNEKIIKKERG